MTRNAEIMAEAMGFLDDELLIEAHPEAAVGVTYPQRVSRRLRWQLALVACLCLVAIGVAQVPDMMKDMTAGNAEAMPSDRYPNATPPDGADGNSMNAGNVGNSGSNENSTVIGGVNEDPEEKYPTTKDESETESESATEETDRAK